MGRNGKKVESNKNYFLIERVGRVGNIFKEWKPVEGNENK